MMCSREQVRAALVCGCIPWLVSLTGCVSGSLASNTGPRPPGHRWSTVPTQMVHVGESVSFDFVLQDASRKLVPPLGLVDYVAFEAPGDYVEIEPDTTGHFSYTFRFDQVRPGDRVEVRATGYRQRDARDRMQVDGQWLRNSSPFDQRDMKMFGDDIRLTVYQAQVEIDMRGTGDDFDPASGVMRLRKTPTETVAVYQDRPHRKGFKMIGPDETGAYTIVYLPDGDEVNPFGITEVEFIVYDVGGKSHVASVHLETP